MCLPTNVSIQSVLHFQKNILISERGEARIVDLSLWDTVSARVGPSNLSVDGVTIFWEMAGNPRWQAPELLAATAFSQARRTRESDIFAFGRVIIEVSA